jgi:myo-inositol-1(or 4)-monophosphatase
MHPMLNIAVKAALSAGKIIMRYYEQLPKDAVTRKGENDFVTIVDKSSEEEIIKILQKNYPSHGFIAEEGSQQESNDYIWIIDPLDGTVNYIHGLPQFCVSIALQYKGRITQAVIYDPLHQELFTASRGGGAQLNDRRIRVSPCAFIEDALLSGTFPIISPDHAAQQIDVLNGLFRHAAGMRHIGAAALELAYIAAGRLDGFWSNDVQMWDVAAGGLIIEEAGGLVSDWQSNPDYLNSGAVVAGNPKMFKQILPLIQRGYLV